MPEKPRYREFSEGDEYRKAEIARAVVETFGEIHTEFFSRPDLPLSYVLEQIGNAAREVSEEFPTIYGPELQRKLTHDEYEVQAIFDKIVVNADANDNRGKMLRRKKVDQNLLSKTLFKLFPQEID